MQKDQIINLTSIRLPATDNGSIFLVFEVLFISFNFFNSD